MDVPLFCIIAKPRGCALEILWRIGQRVPMHDHLCAFGLPELKRCEDLSDSGGAAM